MSLPALRDEVTIRRLRVRARGGDEEATANRAARLVSAARIKPSSLRSGSILLVRSLRDPRPEGLHLDGTLPPAAWEEAVSRQLDELARAAARPAHDAVGSDAEAVVFADLAELLACLARDRLRGVAGEHWWWRLVADPGDSYASLAGEFVHAPREVPAALELLATGGTAADVVASFPASEARLILDGVRREHAVPLLEAETGPLTDETPPAPDTSRAESASWADEVPETAARPLSPVHQELLATCLLVRRRPAYVRTRAFAATAARRRGAATALTPAPRAEQVPPPPSAAATASSERPQVAEVPGVTQREHAGRAAPVGGLETAPPAEAAPAAAEEKPPRRPRAPLPAEPTEPPPAATPFPPVAAVRTELGGVFYLLNVALALELYGDFSTPAAPGIELDPWDFVGVLAERILGAPVPVDPVWELLAGLAGRAGGEPPGAGFRPPHEWRIPPAWLEPFAGDRPPVRRRIRGRHVLLHPRGFPVLDVPRRRLVRRRPRPALDRWLWWVGSYVEARLQATLGLDDPAQIAGRLLRRHAAVHLSSTRVEVVYRLDELPIEVRLAGLDRTPGWIPAAGRHVEIVFE
jgi:hypothetical protein